MPGKMARSAAQPPFRAARVDGSGPRHPPVLPKRRKSAKIAAGSGLIWEFLPGIADGVAGMRFIEGDLESLRRNAAWVRLA